MHNNNLPVFRPIEEQSPVTRSTPGSEKGTHPGTGDPVSVIQGPLRPTVENHLPTREASRALQKALDETPRQLEQRNVTPTAPHSALSTTPVGNNGPHPSSPSPVPPPSSPSPLPPPSAGGVVRALPPGERKGGEGNELDNDFSVGNFEEATKAQEVELALAAKLISNSDVFRDSRLEFMVADSPDFVMQYALCIPMG
ncbi:hypothetical protein LMG27198_21150 [Methylocystis echinoides]|uniref:Uncharacterized protein n=1 Tax=Methylocystis echinoides TaxID=29468 RepID=A0A9W6GUE2_9HYPH|nr:hypothetical protein LMG27198_21150 [Methylocystis echinoides]